LKEKEQRTTGRIAVVQMTYLKPDEDDERGRKWRRTWTCSA
jgi:hypothetical protein